LEKDVRGLGRATIPVWDRHTSLPWQPPLFVGALGASSYTFAEATRDQQMESWLSAPRRLLPVSPRLTATIRI
jgi:transposase